MMLCASNHVRYHQKIAPLDLYPLALILWDICTIPLMTLHHLLGFQHLLNRTSIYSLLAASLTRMSLNSTDSFAGGCMIMFTAILLSLLRTLPSHLAPWMP